VNDVATDVGETEVAAAVPVGQFLVIDSQLVQDRRMEIVDVYAILDGFETKFVGAAMRDAALESAARQQHRVTLAVVVAAVLDVDPAARFH